MQPSRGHPRPPGSFSPLPGGAAAAAGGSSSGTISSSSAAAAAAYPSPHPRPLPRRFDSDGSEDGTAHALPPIHVAKSRQSQKQQPGSPATPTYTQFTTHANSSAASLPHAQNFSRPSGTRAAVGHHASASQMPKGHLRKHSANPGLFEPTLPSTNLSNLSQVGMGQGAPTHALSTSQIAAQAAAMSYQNSNSRRRSQTVPFSHDALGVDRDAEGARRGSGSGNKAATSPPVLSLTEASAPRDTGFANSQERGAGGPTHQIDRLGGSHSAATAAANVVFPRSGHSSPSQQPSSPQPYTQPAAPPPAPSTLAEKHSKSERAKAKLFSRAPGKISTKGEASRDKPLPSPGKIGSALSVLQRANFSTSSLTDSVNQSLYSLNNSSSATIRPVETPPADERTREKEKKPHFLSRQKHKLKDEYHLPLSSAASNSRPTDPNAPSSLYSFNVPPSPGLHSTSFAKSKKDKKQADRTDASRLDPEVGYPGQVQSEWPGPSSLPTLSQQSTLYDPVDPGKLGLHNHMSLDDAWPYLKAKLLVVFEGEDLRLPVEDFNRVVQMHIQWCLHSRSPNAMLEDLRDLLATGFSALDRTLRKAPEDRFIPTLVELWVFTFTSILPYMQSIFLPLDLEISGRGTLMTSDQARDFWGTVKAAPPSSNRPARPIPAATIWDVRWLVLAAYRDIVILPRYDTLKTIFSRLSLEFLPSSLANMALASPPPEATMLSTSPPEAFPPMVRPGTAMSLDPSVGSFNSTSTTLFGDGSTGGRSRAISNVSFGSHGSDGALRPFSPSGQQPTTLHMLGSVREQNVEDSKQLTDMMGRMLQCMSVLASLGGEGDVDVEGSRKIAELGKMLKLNWLGRGRTGRNRRGLVGGRVRRGETREVRVA